MTIREDIENKIIELRDKLHIIDDGLNVFNYSERTKQRELNKAAKIKYELDSLISILDDDLKG